MLRTDVLVGVLIFAFTAVPAALRWPSPQVVQGAVSLHFYLFDVVANVLGYVPLGMVLARHGWRRALLLGGLLSACAEAVQLFSAGRDPSVVDVVSNVLGAGVGVFIAAKWRLPDVIAVTNRGGAVAAAAAATYMIFGGTFTAEAPLKQLRAWSRAPPWMSTNPRGADSNGIIEARLSFDHMNGDIAEDMSRNRLLGRTGRGPVLTAGVVGSGISLNGKQWVDLGNPVALRLTGSMTLSAWIKPLAFPKDDAAIISSLTDSELGYQLDLTVDQGPRTIGFKIANSSNHLMARYGRTPLVTGRWYHVAGVYDSAASTLDVYLDGRRDNGCLTGTVTSRQQPSGEGVAIGRRAGMAGFAFIGVIDEAEIQSRASPEAQIATEVSAAAYMTKRAILPLEASNDDVARVGGCVSYSRPLRIAGPFVTLGILIALAFAGFSRRGQLDAVALGLCLLVGSTAAIWSAGTATFESAWQAPLYVLAGGFALFLSRTHPEQDR